MSRSPSNVGGRARRKSCTATQKQNGRKHAPDETASQHIRKPLKPVGPIESIYSRASPSNIGKLPPLVRSLAHVHVCEFILLHYDTIHEPVMGSENLPLAHLSQSVG